MELITGISFDSIVMSAICCLILREAMILTLPNEIAGPGGKITIDASGITLEAPKIDLKGAVSMGGSGSAQVPTLNLTANEGLPLAEECPKKEG